MNECCLTGQLIYDKFWEQTLRIYLEVDFLRWSNVNFCTGYFYNTGQPMKPDLATEDGPEAQIMGPLQGPGEKCRLHPGEQAFGLAWTITWTQKKNNNNSIADDKLLI